MRTINKYDWKAKLAIISVIIGAVFVSIFEPKDAGKMVVLLGGILLFVLKKEGKDVSSNGR